MSNSQQSEGAAGPERGVLLAMAVACGITVANIYYSQPLLGIMEHYFPGQESIVGFVPTATQLGYACGIVLLIPLGDRIERRKLILVQIAVLCATMLGAALAPTPWALVLASGVMGICATVPQQIVPFAAEIATPERRGQAIGTVMSGLLCGILLSRTVAGFIGEHLGWRIVYLVGIAGTVGVGVLLAATLPRVAPRSSLSYGRLLGSLATLIHDEPALRRSTLIQGTLFASFSAFWTILALRLEQPPFGLGADVAGSFGIVGAIGVMIAPLAGRIADRRGPQAGIGFGIATMLAAWIALVTWGSLIGLVVGVILLDIGQQMAMISNQHVVFALNPGARNRLNTVLMSGTFIGASLGSAGATLCWTHGGWLPVGLLGAGFVSVALALYVAGRLLAR